LDYQSVKAQGPVGVAESIFGDVVTERHLILGSGVRNYHASPVAMIARWLKVRAQRQKAIVIAIK
jgi:hypothetical protein